MNSLMTTGVCRAVRLNALTILSYFTSSDLTDVKSMCLASL